MRLVVRHGRPKRICRRCPQLNGKIGYAEKANPNLGVNLACQDLKHLTPVDEPKSDEITKSISGDVTRVSKGDRQADHESTESEPSTESERRERHTKAFNELPARIARELSSEYEDAHKAGNIPVSREVGEFIQHVLADAKFPGKVYTHLSEKRSIHPEFPRHEWPKHSGNHGGYRPESCCCTGEASDQGSPTGS